MWRGARFLLFNMWSWFLSAMGLLPLRYLLLLERRRPVKGLTFCTEFFYFWPSVYLFFKKNGCSKDTLHCTESFTFTPNAPFFVMDSWNNFPEVILWGSEFYFLDASGINFPDVIFCCFEFCFSEVPRNNFLGVILWCSELYFLDVSIIKFSDVILWCS